MNGVPFRVVPQGHRLPLVKWTPGVFTTELVQFRKWVGTRLLKIGFGIVVIAHGMLHVENFVLTLQDLTQYLEHFGVDDEQ